MTIDRQRLRTGIPLIDNQHEAYADLVDTFFAMAMRGNVPKSTLSHEIGKILNYALEHFDAEEHIMLQQKYPAYAEHRAKHTIFRDRSDTLIADSERAYDLDAYTMTLSKWLIEWFCDQVQNDDRKLAAFLSSKQPGALVG